MANGKERKKAGGKTPSKGDKSTPVPKKNDRLKDLDVQKEIGERVRGGRYNTISVM